MNGSFFRALLDSPTALETIGLWFGMAVFAVLSFIWLAAYMARRAKRRNLLADDAGSATAVDMVMTIPIFAWLMLMFVQAASLCNGSLVVHYAAYAAARSARVYAWEEGYGGFYLDTTPQITQLVQAKAEQAARFALIAAAPHSTDVTDGSGAPLWLDKLKGASDMPNKGEMSDALARKANYAFDPANSEVQLAILSDFGPLSPWKLHEVEATVSFHLNIALLPGRVFGQAHGNGYARQVTATMRLL